MSYSLSYVKIAIIGTAGRDSDFPQTKDTWENMCNQAKHQIDLYKQKHNNPHITVVSGGAAWADHVAVWLYLQNHVDAIELYLPAPIKDGKYDSLGFKTAGSISNYYHSKMSNALGYNTIKDIEDLINHAETTSINALPAGMGIAALFERNTSIADAADILWAFTTAPGDTPGSSGTLDTWNKFEGFKQHFSIPMPKVEFDV